MQNFYKPARIITLFVFMAIVLSFYSAVLYRMQVYSAPETLVEDLMPLSKTTRTEILVADRGDILDRNGVLLVSSRPSYSVSLNRAALLMASDTNEILLGLAHYATERGVAYRDTFPITIGAPFTYAYNMSDTQRDRLNKYFEYFNLEPDISASDLIVWLKSHYGIDYTTGIADARLIIGLRYEMEIRVIIPSIPTFVFADDVDVAFVSEIKESSWPGVTVSTGVAREYHTQYAAHLLGYLRRMDAADYEIFGPLGYPMDAFVGKTGAERAFEEYLHGVDGEQIVTTGADGSVVDVVVTKEPIPGGNVYLTIDIALQETAENALAEFIDLLNQEPERGEDERAMGGAVAVTDPETGELLAAASYPSFNPATLAQDINALSQDLATPLVNRAMQGMYNPGSTFKMVTGLAGLRAGVITRWTQIDDLGRYTKYKDYQPKCWIFPGTHGYEDIVTALRDSCNYFFYRVGDDTGADRLWQTAMEFGLGEKTGLEVSEITGTLSTPDYKKKVTGESWYGGDTLLASIGQGHNMFTPVQLANYVATLANGGTHYALTLLRNVRTADFSGVTYAHEPEVRNVIEDTEYLSYLREGMRSSASTGTASSVFGNYPVRVSAKTGTVQSDTSVINNGVFVCYAPSDNPQLAISVVVEKGGSGAAVMEISRVVMDSYFKSEQATTIVPEGVLVP